jgi:hypothetical protein
MRFGRALARTINGEHSGHAVVPEDHIVAAILLVASVFAALAVLGRDLFQRDPLYLDACRETNSAISGRGRSVLVRASKSLSVNPSASSMSRSVMTLDVGRALIHRQMRASGPLKTWTTQRGLITASDPSDPKSRKGLCLALC